VSFLYRAIVSGGRARAFAGSALDELRRASRFLADQHPTFRFGPGAKRLASGGGLFQRRGTFDLVQHTLRVAIGMIPGMRRTTLMVASSERIGSSG
jgi:hypothetical protein